jgi:bisanhydrobacterioruberin hydratase
MITFLNKHKLLLARIIILIGYGISVPGLWIMRENPSVFKLSWIFTTLTLVLLLVFHKPFNLKFALSIVAVGIIGWAVEAIGTNTGIIFGGYSYGPSLGPKIFATPFAMIINWMISVYLITMVLRPKIINIWRLGFAGALLMVIYDILLEPVAIRLDMWSWETGTPPLQNYVAWFIISFPLVMLMGKFVKKANNPLSFMVLVSQILFFATLNLMIFYFGM